MHLVPAVYACPSETARDDFHLHGLHTCHKLQGTSSLTSGLEHIPQEKTPRIEALPVADTNGNGVFLKRAEGSVYRGNGRFKMGGRRAGFTA